MLNYGITLLFRNLQWKIDECSKKKNDFKLILFSINQRLMIEI